MLKIGIFFGTFNPLHNGHLMLAQYVVDNTDLDEVLFMPTPSSSFKEHADGLLSYSDRCSSIYKATLGLPKLGLSTVENELPAPHYTSETLRFLSENCPDDEFAVIFGADNLGQIETFHNFRYILDNHDIYVFPRGEADISHIRLTYSQARIHVLEDAPLTNLSSTFVRQQLAKGNDISVYVPAAVVTMLAQFEQRSIFMNKQTNKK